MALKVRIEKKLHAFPLRVEFETADGVTALLGASGSGKSMTLKCIAGVETPDAGYIELDGRVLYDSARRINLPPQQRHIGYLFQNYALFPTMTVAENIASGVHKSRTERARVVEEKLKTFYLTDVADKLPQQLSGGQQQRVALARILASEPQAILLDEPFSALDSYLKWQLEPELMDALKAFAGVTLFVSHDRDEVYRNCARVVAVHDGASEPMVPVRALFESPATKSAALLSGCKNYAAAERCSAGTLAVPAWNCTLRCRETPEAFSCIGIRAHHLHPAAEGEDNALPCRIVRVTEELFSTVLTLQVEGAVPDAPTLRMELPKAQYAALGGKERLTVGVAPGDLLLLQ